MTILLALTQAAACGSRPEPGLWDGGFATGNCSNGASGQFTCTPDPGSQAVDCEAAEQGLELVTIGDFSTAGSVNAKRFYVYTDRSGQGRVSSFDQGWEPSTVEDPFPRCENGRTPRALHIQGGPFYGWGGGFGTSMKDFVPNDAAYGCLQNSQSPLCLPETDELASENVAVDASGFEGVAVWARRGPDSQGGMRILVGDINTDDDISYLMYQKDPTRKRNCERVRECGCTNHKPCQRWDTAPLEMQTPNLSSWKAAVDAERLDLQYQMWSCASAGYYCEDPAADVIPGYFTSGGMTTRCNSCAQTRCDEQYEAYPDGIQNDEDKAAEDQPNDSQFNGKPCTPYTFRSGVTSAYCFDPATDPPPAEQDEQCGDHWTRPIYLTNQWQLHLVPFTEMLQQGWAKRFGKMDTSHVTVVRLTWDGGYIDYWVGWVGFYRHRR